MTTTKTADGAEVTNLPLVVLVNEKTAGSAEVLASALQDSQRATVVGVQTQGKGSVQVMQPLSFGGALRIRRQPIFLLQVVRSMEWVSLLMSSSPIPNVKCPSRSRSLLRIVRSTDDPWHAVHPKHVNIQSRIHKASLSCTARLRLRKDGRRRILRSCKRTQWRIPWGPCLGRAHEATWRSAGRVFSCTWI